MHLRLVGSIQQVVSLYVRTYVRRNYITRSRSKLNWFTFFISITNRRRRISKYRRCLVVRNWLAVSFIIGIFSSIFRSEKFRIFGARLFVSIGSAGRFSDLGVEENHFSHQILPYHRLSVCLSVCESVCLLRF